MLRMLASAVALSALALASCTTPAETVDTAPQVAAAKPAGPHPGEAVYQAKCAACHDNSAATKAPSPETLARLTPGHITNSLMTGIMIPLSRQGRLTG
jgi:polyvinyl alcohol dehydrogenase (cytochrome)